MTQSDEENAGSQARLPLVENPSDPLAAELLDEVFQRTGRVLNLHRILAHAPGVMQGSHAFAMALRHSVDLPRALIELAILRTSQIGKSDYEWQQHVPMALSNGVTQQKIDDLSNWRDSNLYSDTERVILAYTDSVATDTEPPADEFAELREKLSPREIVELTLIIGHYIMIGRFISALGIPLEVKK